jgi:hypothetical protein
MSENEERMFLADMVTGRYVNVGNWQLHTWDLFTDIHKYMKRGNYKMLKLDTIQPTMTISIYTGALWVLFCKIKNCYCNLKMKQHLANIKSGGLYRDENYIG